MVLKIWVATYECKSFERRRLLWGYIDISLEVVACSAEDGVKVQQL